MERSDIRALLQSRNVGPLNQEVRRSSERMLIWGATRAPRDAPTSKEGFCEAQKRHTVADARSGDCRTGLGPGRRARPRSDKEKVAEEIRREMSKKLAERGWSHLPIVKNQAYKALAASVHGVFENLGISSHYQKIIVTFANDEDRVHQQFNFDNSFCNTLAYQYGVRTGELIIELGRVVK